MDNVTDSDAKSMLLDKRDPEQKLSDEHYFSLRYSISCYHVEEKLSEEYQRVEKSEASEIDFVNLPYFISCHPPCPEPRRDEVWQ